MRYYYTITFQGFVNEPSEEIKGEEQLVESITDIENLVRDSFAPDLQHGVMIESTQMHVGIMHEPPPILGAAVK